MRLVILCEGTTEKLVLKEFLQPYTKDFRRVDVYTPGGNAKLVSEFKKLAETELEDDAQAIVFCFIDLLEAPFTFPKRLDEAINPYLARYVYVQRYMREQIRPDLRERCYVFPIVMEIETWLLADGGALNDYLRPPRAQRISPYSNPENTIHPTEELKALIKRFRDEDYIKTLHGKRLFKRAKARNVYEDNCPHFEVIINQLLELQGVEPERPTPVFRIPKQELYLSLVHLQQEYDSIFERASKLALHDFSEAEWQRLFEIEIEMTKINQQIMDME